MIQRLSRPQLDEHRCIKHKKHGMNVQVLADASGRLLWASPALPGAVHDVRAAREHDIIAALTDAGITYWADSDVCCGSDRGADSGTDWRFGCPWADSSAVRAEPQRAWRCSLRSSTNYVQHL
jgi:hypothetical protein